MGDWITIGGFWVSIFMAIVVISAVLVSYIVYRASSAPNVIVYADDDERRPTMIVLAGVSRRGTYVNRDTYSTPVQIVQLTLHLGSESVATISTGNDLMPG